MTRYLWVLMLCGCAFDLSTLGPMDSGTTDSEIQGDSEVDASFVGDSSMTDADDAGQDSWVDQDSGNDAWTEVSDGGLDAGSDAGPDSPLVCTDIPDISGMYRINRRLMGCTTADFGYVPLTRLDECGYEFDDGGALVFDGSCNVIIEGLTHRFECTLTYNVWHYRCTIDPVSGGLNVDCHYLSGTSPPTTDPCSFFAPEM